METQYKIGYSESDGSIAGYYVIDCPEAVEPPGAFMVVTREQYEAALTARANHVVEGKAVFIAPPVPQPTPEQQLASFISAIQTRLDEFAKTRGYANILSAATYANSTVPRFAAEGQYALRIRDETWLRGYALMDEVKAGTRPMPASNEELFALLPRLEWPK